MNTIIDRSGKTKATERKWSAGAAKKTGKIGPAAKNIKGKTASKVTGASLHEKVKAIARLEVRTTPAVQDKIKLAADIQGRTITDFVISAAESAAQKAIEEAYIIRLSIEDQNAFTDALLSPPKPTEALSRAFVRHSELKR
ncbi:MAG: DUF1778 domain-containing protein [Chlorobiales bacterium]|nr:DUF1778 domain-containing protein [Chlorobiales bacterium]